MSTVVTKHPIASRALLKLPDGWRHVRLGDVCNLVNGDAYKESDWSTSGVPIIRIQNLNDLSRPFNYWTGPLNDRVRVEPGDVLLAWSGTPGTSFGAHLWSGGSAVLNQHIFRVDLDPAAVDPKWAVIAVNRELEALIQKAHGGVGLRHVTRREVESLKIVLPPLPDQRRIVTILSDRLALVKTALATAEERLEAARALPAASLRTVFAELPAAKWTRRRLDEVAELLPAKSIASDGEAEVLAITTACLTETGFLATGVKLARMRKEDVPYCTVSAGEVLVARSNTPDLVGRASLFAGEPKGAVASDLTVRILPREGMSAAFLTAYLSFLFLKGHWKERSGGASGSMKKITRGQIAALRVPVPDVGVQERLAATLSSRAVTSMKLAAAIAQEIAALRALSNALVRRAFAGGL